MLAPRILRTHCGVPVKNNQPTNQPCVRVNVSLLRLSHCSAVFMDRRMEYLKFAFQLLVLSLWIVPSQPGSLWGCNLSTQRVVQDPINEKSSFARGSYAVGLHSRSQSPRADRSARLVSWLVPTRRSNPVLHWRTIRS
jgi:hypothetical protein